MKKLFVILVTLAFTTAARGQGKVFLDNKVNGVVDAPVFLFGLETGPGPSYSAQLFLVEDNGSLSPLTPVTTFAPPGTSGPALTASRYLIPQTVDVPVIPGAEAAFLIRAWRTADGSYAASLYRGQSDPFVIKVGGGSLPPSDLITLKSFGIIQGIFPEPSTIALGVLGTVILFLRSPRRP